MIQKNKKDEIAMLHDIALANVFTDEMPFEYFYRKKCRDFSRLFHTPLPVVEKMPFYEVLTHLFEHSFEEILDSSDQGKAELEYIAQKVLDPDFDKKKEADLEAFVKKMNKKTEEIKAQPKEVKKIYNEPPPPEMGIKDDSGLDSLVDGIGSED